jgi:hypothetical protein
VNESEIALTLENVPFGWAARDKRLVSGGIIFEVQGQAVRCGVQARHLEGRRSAGRTTPAFVMATSSADPVLL